MAMFTLTEIENELGLIMANTSKKFFGQSCQDITPLMRKQVFNMVNYLVDNQLFDKYKLQEEEVDPYEEPGSSS